MTAISALERLRQCEEERRRRYKLPPLPADAPTPMERIWQALTAAGVEFIVIGGQAAVLVGAKAYSSGVEVCQRLNSDNRTRLGVALAGFSLASQPLPEWPDRSTPYRPDEIPRLARDTRIDVVVDGDIWLDIIGDVPQIGTYAELRPGAEEIRLDEMTVLVQGVADQIRTIDALEPHYRALKTDVRTALAAIQETRQHGLPQ